jgi:hypothetical protein
MSFAALVDRVRGEYTEMPGLELTVSQAARLWNLGPDDCHLVIDALVDAGFLAWTPRRTIVRTGREMRMQEAWIDPSDIPERKGTRRNNFVDRD